MITGVEPHGRSAGIPASSRSGEQPAFTAPRRQDQQAPGPVAEEPRRGLIGDFPGVPARGSRAAFAGGRGGGEDDGASAVGAASVRPPDPAWPGLASAFNAAAESLLGGEVGRGEGASSLLQRPGSRGSGGGIRASSVSSGCSESEVERELSARQLVRLPTDRSKGGTTRFLSGLSSTLSSASASLAPSLSLSLHADGPLRGGQGRGGHPGEHHHRSDSAGDSGYGGQGGGLSPPTAGSPFRGTAAAKDAHLAGLPPPSPPSPVVASPGVGGGPSDHHPLRQPGVALTAGGASHSAPLTAVSPVPAARALAARQLSSKTLPAAAPISPPLGARSASGNGATGDSNTDGVAPEAVGSRRGTASGGGPAPGPRPVFASPGGAASGRLSPPVYGPSTRSGGNGAMDIDLLKRDLERLLAQ
ncbi:hypothetical protein GPECTOR_10g915 [Gonium pectorale]|uniref:Uncharacterized protein n=1 Tax=Gonium pectorale TaxID=33097 RepID=A0A150GR70_GONPE|nr:hypothetical protein GPECTOR_10g915 [Gonium pectorale]|eukprot:KXZ52283.1 hypothetical protein GPECTOR_10g915 [Gonium pectorale]